MKNTYILVALIFYIFCYGQKKTQPDLEFSISNKCIKDGDTLNISLKNNSTTNYYIIFDKNKTIKHFTTNYTYTANIVLVDSNNSEIGEQIYDYQCYDQDAEEKLVKLTNRIDILEVKSNQVIKFVIPFNLKTIINDYCWYEFLKSELDINKNYYVEFKFKFYEIYFDSAICIKTKENQKKKGYNLYSNEINSNKVLLKLKK